VVVPLGRRTATGVVLGPATEPAANVRDVVRLLDDAPLLSAEIVELARWASAHYLSPLGPALKVALPPGIDVRDALAPRLTERGRALLAEGQLDLPGQEGELRRALRKAASGVKLGKARLASLARQGLVELVREEEEARVTERLVEVVQAASDASLEAVKRAPKQAEVLAWLLARGAAVPLEELVAAFPQARRQLRGLVQRKLASVSKVLAGPAVVTDAPWGSQEHDATPAQAAALQSLKAALDARSFAPFLLHGVTGSGKTWVYLEAIAHARSKGLGALALVPEIALTPQLAGRFRARFGDDVAVLHSGLSERERLGEWMRVQRGEAGIVVGARSAVWAPVRRLGIAVVDEEHEPSYKQEDRLRYHARDLLLVRAQRAGAVAVLGSATPSLESLRRAQEGKLTTLRLPERVDARPLPPSALIKRTAADVFTPDLAGALRETLARGEQAILFLNRRGHTRSLLCSDCGAVAGCPNCGRAGAAHSRKDAAALPPVRAPRAAARDVRGVRLAQAVAARVRHRAHRGGAARAAALCAGGAARSRFGGRAGPGRGGAGALRAARAGRAGRDADGRQGARLPGRDARRRARRGRAAAPARLPRRGALRAAPDAGRGTRGARLAAGARGAAGLQAGRGPHRLRELRQRRAGAAREAALPSVRAPPRGPPARQRGAARARRSGASRRGGAIARGARRSGRRARARALPARAAARQVPLAAPPARRGPRAAASHRPRAAGRARPVGRRTLPRRRPGQPPVGQPAEPNRTPVSGIHSGGN
jgi:hypothetical protein